MATLFIVYIPVEDPDSPFIRQASVEPTPPSSRGKTEECEATEETRLLGECKLNEGATENTATVADDTSNVVPQNVVKDSEQQEDSKSVQQDSTENSNENTDPSTNDTAISPEEETWPKKMVSFDNDLAPMATESVTLTMVCFVSQ